ncbi:U3 small nucleolar RNA-associated protein 13 [Trapelia coarctata]|nr:U3 small nucleolar RNA-associated protein 13 [Trapelia coarctata]
MALRPNVTTTFEVDKVIQPIYTGGDVDIDYEGQILVACIGEDALLTDLSSGQTLARIEGDGEVLTTLLITPSASHVITCSRSLSMRIYFLEPANDNSRLLNPILQRTLKPHTTPVITGAVDRTGTLLATGGADGVVKVWDIRGGYVSHTFRGHAGVISALHFFEASISDPDTEVSARNKSMSERPKSDREDVDMINAPAGDNDSVAYRLASGSEDGKIRIWDLEKRKAIATLDSHVSVVRSLCFSPEQNALVSGSRDKTAIVWDARNWKSRRVIPVLESIEGVCFLKEGMLVCTGGESNVVRVWESATGREITEEQAAEGEDQGIIQLLHNPSLDFVLSVHTNQNLLLHSLTALSELESGGIIDPLPLLRRISGTHDEIIDLAYVTANRELLALATNSEDIRLVSLASEDIGLNSPSTNHYFGADVALLQGHEDIIICLDVDWSGCWLATGAKDNMARLWRIDHPNKSYGGFAIFSGHAESLGAISFPNQPPPVGSAAHSEPLAHPPPFLITGSQDRTIKKWETVPKNAVKGERRTPRALFTRKAHDKDINAIVINYSSTLFASASQDRTVKIWSVEEGEVQGVLRGHRRGVWSVKFAAKDTPPISGDSGPASSSRGLVLTGSGDKTVKIWSLTDYSCLRTLEGHTNSVLKVLWMPLPQQNKDSESDVPRQHHNRKIQIATAGGDGLVKIWDAQTGECDTTLDNHTDRVWALASNPVDNTLVSGGGDSVVTFWKDTTSATIAASSEAATQRVEQEQMLQNYVHAGRYREAITLALQLNYPGKLLSLFTNVVNTSPPEAGSLSGVREVDEVLRTLGDEQLFTLLLRLRDWNTNARTAPVAQKILWILVKSYPAGRLAGLRGKGRGRGVGEVFDGLKAYTERHYKRMEELVGESYLVDFVLREMEVGGFVGEDVGREVLGEGVQDVIMV